MTNNCVDARSSCAYIDTLSRDGLNSHGISSEDLRESVVQGFSILDLGSNAIGESGIPNRKAAEYLLLKAINFDVKLVQ